MDARNTNNNGGSAMGEFTDESARQRFIDDVLDVMEQAEAAGKKPAVSNVLAALRGGRSAMRSVYVVRSGRRWSRLGPLGRFESLLTSCGFRFEDECTKSTGGYAATIRCRRVTL